METSEFRRVDLMFPNLAQSVRKSTPPPIEEVNEELNIEMTRRSAKKRRTSPYSRPPSSSPASSQIPCGWKNCTETFANQNDRYLHIPIAHGMDVGIKDCRFDISGQKLCGYLSRSRSHYLDHIIKHFPSCFKPLKCQVSYHFTDELNMG